MNKESTRKFLIAFTVLWGVCFVPSLFAALGSLFTLDVTDSRNVWVPFVFIPLCFLLPIFIVQSIIGSWISYKRGKFKQAKLISLLPLCPLAVISFILLVAFIVSMAISFKHTHWPTTAEEYDDLAEEALSDHRYQAAINYFNHLISLQPTCRNYISRGVTYESAKQYVQALSDYQSASQAAQTEPQKAAANYYVARIYYLTGHYKEALPICDDVLHTPFNDQTVYGHECSLALRSAVYKKLEKHRLAQQDINQIRKLGEEEKDPIQYLLDFNNRPSLGTFTGSETN